MFFYTSDNRFRHRLVLQRLSTLTVDQYIDEMASWSESAWGYMQNFPGLDNQKENIRSCPDNFYVILYANLPIGMFALKDDYTRQGNSKKLMNFYVDPSFRGMGVGKRMFDMVIDISRSEKFDTLTFNTLNPRLNGIYIKYGAKYLCELPVTNVSASLLCL